MVSISFKNILCVLLVVTTFSSYSQELLSSDEAVTITLENNLGIVIAKNTAQTATNNASILNSGYLPTVSGSAGANINRQNIDGELSSGDTRKSKGVENRTYNASVSINYTLFDGLGRHYNYKRLQEEEGLSELQVEETIENTMLQLFSVYYEVARLTENKENLERALEISKDRLTRAKYQFEYGQNTGLDVLNAEVDVNTDSINVLNAEQQLKNIKRDLNLVMNRDLSIDFNVDTLVTFVPNLIVKDLFAKASENNIRIKQIEKNITINEYLYKANKSGYLPTIGLSGSYGWNQSHNNNPLAFTVQNTTSGISGGVSLSWNIFDGGRRETSIKNAKISYKNQELLKLQIEKEVERDIANAWEIYTNAMFILQTQEKNVVTTKNNFERTQERFKIGQTTSLEFRQAQINYLNAILAKNQAKYTAKLAELSVLQVSGSLLDTEF